MLQTSNPDLWNQVWSQSNQDKAEFWEWVERESCGVRGSKIQDYIRNYVGDFHGLKTIEVGCGFGIYSFIFARLGAEVTLLDYSEKALNFAREVFHHNGLKANFILLDALNLKKELYGRYDVAMSFGTVEHFRYPERLKMVEAHVNLIRDGGVIAVSTPNKAFFPHEILKTYLQSKNKWHLGYEGSFSRSEFLRLSKAFNLKNSKIIGSSFLADFQKYLKIYSSTSLFQQVLGLDSVSFKFQERASWLDNVFGADLVLMGVKNL